MWHGRFEELAELLSHFPSPAALRLLQLFALGVWSILNIGIASFPALTKPCHAGQGTHTCPLTKFRLALSSAG